jgi:hypothetical protein
MPPPIPIFATGSIHALVNQPCLPLTDDALVKIKDHPNLLGNVWTDEPTGNSWGKDMEGQFRAFTEPFSKGN